MKRMAVSAAELIVSLLGVDPSEMKSERGRFVFREQLRDRARRNEDLRQKREQQHSMERQERLQAILGTARHLLDQDHTGRSLDELTLMIGRPLQYELINRVIRATADPNHPQEHDETLDDTPWVPRGANIAYSVAIEMQPERLAIGRNLILPRVWCRQRLLTWLPLLGAGRRRWREDTQNHYVTWLWPMRVGLVEGGNHSIACGISASVGVLTPQISHDLSGVYEQISCDGDAYYETSSGRLLEKVRDERLAAIYEIGRLRLQ